MVELSCLLNYQFPDFSRRGYEYTKVFGSGPREGWLTPRIHSFFDKSVENCILDGEMMLWHIEENRFISKGEGVNFLNMDINAKVHQLCFCVFDILWLNGKNMINFPYYERIRVLSQVFMNSSGNIIRVTSNDIKNKNELLNQLHNTVNDHDEGIIIKKKNNKYYPGKRGSGWYKVKPDYVDGMITDLDLIILGIFLKEFRINGVVAGLRDNEKYLALTVIYSGFSNEQLNDMYESLKSLWKPFKNGGKTANTENIDFGLLMPDYYINPADLSLVVQVKSTELYKSKIFPTIYTLRFPRIVCIRNDKSVMDVCTFDELKPYFATESTRKVAKISKDIFNNQKKPNKVMDDMNQIESKNEQPEINHLLDICLLSMDMSKKTDIEELIIKNRGRIVVTPGKLRIYQFNYEI